MIDFDNILGQDWTDFLRLIQQSPASVAPVINELYQHSASNRGKRLRAKLVLLSAKAFNYHGTDHISLACIVEWLHAATLIHDDIIDNAQKRSNADCAHIKFSNTCAVLGGDYLYGMAFSKIAALNMHEITSCIAQATTEIIEGELLQLQAKDAKICAEEFYYQVIERKTAKLFAVCTQTAAIIANHSSNARNFGYHYGLAYQLFDDLQDYLGQSAKLGKALGNDFAEGKMTLPAIKAMQLHNLSPTDFFAIEFTDAVNLLRAGDCVPSIIAAIVTELDLADSSLKHVAKSEYCLGLLELTASLRQLSSSMIKA